MGWRSELKAIRSHRVGLRVLMDSKYFWENAGSPDLASHTRVSFLLTPTAVPEKAANQPVGGNAILWLKCWLCLHITAQRAILCTRLMLLVLRFVFLHGKHTNAICHLFTPHPLAPENVVLSVCRPEPRLPGFPATDSYPLGQEFSNTSQMDTSSAFHQTQMTRISDFSSV